MSRSITRAVALFISLGSVALLAAACGRSGPAQTAEKLVDAIAKGDFTAATKDFDSTVATGMPADRLKQTWTQLQAQVGAFKERTESRVTKEPGYEVVLVACKFEKAVLDVKVVVGKDGKISGLFFVNHTEAVSEYRAPPYADKVAFTESDVSVGEGESALPGTLAMPTGDGPFPAVVLVHGSGPEDRDETIGPNRPFKDIAWGLASKGVAVLRYDKRTFDPRGKKTLAAGAGTLTVKEEVVVDALAAVEGLRRTAKVDANKVFVLGHSLGAMLAPRIAKADPRIAGIVVMAGCARPLEDAILEQCEYIASLSKPVSAEAREQLAQLRREVAAVKALKPSAAGSANLLGVPPSYWLDLRGYNPAAAAKALRQPILVMQGARDYQVTVADFEVWKRALGSRRATTFRLYPDLNHLFMTGKGKATPAEYEKPGTVSESAVADIATWIRGR